MDFSGDLEAVSEAGRRYRKGTVTFSFTPSSGSTEEKLVTGWAVYYYLKGH